MKERSLKIDNAKGILIILVVIGHFLLPFRDLGSIPLYNFLFLIYSFHMPAFVFLSGYLAKSLLKKGHFSYRKLFSTLWLYLVFQLLVYFSEIPAYGLAPRIDFFHASGAPWYLLALFIWYLLLPIFSYVRGNIKGLVFLCLLITSTFSGYLGGIFSLGDFLALERVLAFAPFFYAGYFLSEKNFSAIFFLTPNNHRATNYRNSRYFFLSLGIVSASLILLFASCELRPYWHAFLGVWYDRYRIETIPLLLQTHIWMIRVLYYILSALLIFAFLCLCSDKKTVLTKLGERSLAIYILHRPVRDLLLGYGILERLHPDTLPGLATLILLSIFCSFILGNAFFFHIVCKVRDLPSILLSRLR